MKTRLVAAAGALTLLGLTACSTIAEPDEILLYYTGGSFEGSKFQECVQPSTKGPGSVNNNVYSLPWSLRTWNVTPSDGGDTKNPTIVGSKQDSAGQAGPQVAVWSTTEFYLNTNCDGGKDSPVVQFWEKTGRRKPYEISDNEGQFNEVGWRKLLENTLVPVQQKVLQRVARNYTADEMDTNVSDTWRKMEDAMQAEFTEQLRQKVGGDYFCGIEYVRGAKECPSVRISITDINYADASFQEKRLEVRKAAEDSKKRIIEAQAKVAESKLLAQAGRDPNYMRLKELESFNQAAEKCAASPNCTLIITPPGGTAGVNVNTK